MTTAVLKNTTVQMSSLILHFQTAGAPVKESGASFTGTAPLIADQSILLLAALIILGISLVLKVIITVTLLVMASRQQKSISSLLGHPCVKSSGFRLLYLSKETLSNAGGHAETGRGQPACPGFPPDR